MYSQRKSLEIRGETTKDIEILDYISMEVTFLYFFDMINEYRNTKSFQKSYLDRIKNEIFNRVTGNYLEKANIKNFDFWAIKSYILDHSLGEMKLGLTTNNTKSELVNILESQDQIARSLDKKMLLVQQRLDIMKVGIKKAKSDGEDFEKVFAKIYDEYIISLFPKTDFEPLRTNDIRSRIKALMRSFFLGSALFENYLQDYTLLETENLQSAR